MKRIAIAGGIGAGKTAVTDRLASLGFTIIDADEVARRVTDCGSPAWQALRDAFGDAVINDDRSLARDFVAEIVFHNVTALRRLNQITHGHIGNEIARQLDEAKGPAAFVALPLFRPEHRSIFRLDEAWSIQASPEVAVARLMNYRLFSENDARARLASQMTNDERSAIVDRVIWNDGDLQQLYEQLDVQLHRIGLRSG
jgi:dephospho-CoA kinase